MFHKHDHPSFCCSRRPAGKLVGRYYDAAGQPTTAIARFGRNLKRARKERKKQKEEEKKHPNCNSAWSQKEGGKVC